MRRAGLLIAVLAVALLAGCSGKAADHHHAPRPAAPVPGEMSVVLAGDVGDAQKQAVQSFLRRNPAVRSVTYVSKEDAYEAMKKAFKDRPEVGEALRPEQMSESFRVRLRDRDAGPALIDQARRLAGVRDARMLTTGTPRPTAS